jgi:hypothetical protein
MDVVELLLVVLAVVDWWLFGVLMLLVLVG